jgi:predicted amidohydrolase YtcJ
MDLIVSGHIRTLASRGAAIADYARIRAGQITDVGPGIPAADQACEHLDFGDRTIIPGFVDPHAHLEASALALGIMVDVRVPRCTTVSDVLETLRDAIKAGRHEGNWLRAQANLFFNQKLLDKRYPTRAELDGVSRTVPIAVHAGGHTTLLNTRAIELADLHRFSRRSKGAMGGAVIETDADGLATGVVSEVDSLLPITIPEDLDLDVVLTEGARALFTQYGVTVVGDISGSPDEVRRLAILVESGQVSQRLRFFICAPGTLDFSSALHSQYLIPSGARRVDVQGIKVFADGGFSSKNAAVHTAYRRPYALRPGSRGKLNLDSRQLASMIRRAAEAGLQLAVHANGERAQDAVVSAAAEVRKAFPSAPTTRVEHAGNLLTRSGAIDGWRNAGIEPMPQPVFLYNFGDFFPEYLGPVASSGRFPFRMLHDEGFALAASSDVFTGAEDRQTNPFFSIWCCLRRQTFLGDVVEPGQAITLNEALRMHTLNAARALGLDHLYGSIEAGKTADLIVLDRDPFQCSIDDLPSIQVDHVIVDGRLVHSRNGATHPLRDEERL